MDIFRRLSLAFLLALLLIGIGGHLLAPVSGSHHILSESSCAIHHGMNLPANLQISLIEPGILVEITHADTCVLELVLKIPHPPAL